MSKKKWTGLETKVDKLIKMQRAEDRAAKQESRAEKSKECK